MEEQRPEGIAIFSASPQTDHSVVALPPLRLAVGLGDPGRERDLLPALRESDTFVVAERCLAADQLLSVLQTDRIDAVLVAADLHRFSERLLQEIIRTGVPLVILAPPGLNGSWLSAGIVVPSEANPAVIRDALLAAVRRESPQPSSHRSSSPVEPTPALADGQPSPTLALLVVASGHGSPGRTMVAVNLAVALGAVAPTLLVDADLGGASIAPYLDADPTRNLAMLAHAAPETPRDWERALDQETQTLTARNPQGAVLCGVPKPELRSNVSPRFFERLLAEARRRYRYVIVDIGTDLLGAEVTLHRLALGLADQILLVSTADLIGLYHARNALGLLRTQLGIPPSRVALLINRRDRSYHHDRAEIEWTLGLPAAAVIPEDHAVAERALAAQCPLVLDRRSRAGRVLLDLAERIHGGSVALPPEVPNGARRWLPKLPLASGLSQRVHQTRARNPKGGLDGSTNGALW